MKLFEAVYCESPLTLTEVNALFQELREKNIASLSLPPRKPLDDFPIYGCGSFFGVLPMPLSSDLADPAVRFAAPSAVRSMIGVEEMIHRKSDLARRIQNRKSQLLLKRCFDL